MEAVTEVVSKASDYLWNVIFDYFALRNRNLFYNPIEVLSRSGNLVKGLNWYLEIFL